MNNELSINPDKSEISLETNKSDRAVIALKGAISNVPIVGSILSEVVGVVIPNQKADRIKLFVEVLAEKLKYIEIAVLDFKMKSEKFTDLFEDALPQAARALTDERRQYIANFLKNSLFSDDVEHLKEKKLLSLLNELNDAEIIILKYYGTDPGNRYEFKLLHENILGDPPHYYEKPPRSEWEKNVLTDSYQANLEALGLIAHEFKTPRKDELPEYDEKTGRLKSTFTDITSLGEILLRYINDDFDKK